MSQTQPSSNLNSLELEYAVVYKMYEEAYANYQKTLKDSVAIVEEDPCKVFSKDSVNISQECYKKIWNDAGCTEPEQDVKSDYLSALTKKGLKNDTNLWATMDDDVRKQGCYGSADGKQASDKLATIKGYTYEDGKKVKSVDAASKSDCVDACANNKKCTGATYNDAQQLCWVKTGNGEITEGGSDDYAIVSILKQRAFVLKQLNAKLIEINKNMLKAMTMEDVKNSMSSGSSSSQSDPKKPVAKYIGLFIPSETTIRLNKLIADKEEIDKAISELDSTAPSQMNGELLDSAMTVKQAYLKYLFMFFVLLCLFAFLAMGTVFSKIIAVLIVMVLFVMFFAAKS
jgi:hypothetical protein